MGENHSDQRERNPDCVALNQCIGEIKVTDDAAESSVFWYSMSQKRGVVTKRLSQPLFQFSNNKD